HVPQPPEAAPDGSSIPPGGMSANTRVVPGNTSLMPGLGWSAALYCAAGQLCEQGPKEQKICKRRGGQHLDDSPATEASSSGGMVRWVLVSGVNKAGLTGRRKAL